MRKTTFLLSFLWFGISLLCAQTVLLRQTHALVPGGLQKMLKVEFIKPSQAGEDLIWDFRNLSFTGEEKSNTQEVNIENNPYDFDAHLLIQTAETSSTYFRLDENRNECVGSYGENYVLRYSKPIVRMLYPFAYGHYYTNSYSGKGLYQNRYQSEITGEYTFNADAYGTIVLDNDTLFDVLRVRTETNKYEFTRCQHTQMEQVKYLYYIAQQPYPVFTSIETMWIDQKKDTTYHKTCALNARIEKQTSSSSFVPTPKKAEVKDYQIRSTPNPFTDELSVYFILDEPTYVSVELLTIEGIKVANVSASKTLNAGIYTFNYAGGHLSAGVYLLRYIFNDQIRIQQVIKSK